MAANTSKNLDYYVEIENSHRANLANIRHWNNLKFGVESNKIWLKNFTETQIGSAELLSIPFIKIYYGKDNLLFPQNSIIPIAKIPNLLWSPIDLALKIELDKLNHNYFGLDQTIDIKLVPSQNEKNATFLLAEVEDVNQYVLKASSIRLKPLSWLLIDSDKVLIWGEPMLPIKGKTYWLSNKFILPVGFNFEFPSLDLVILSKFDLLPNQKIWWYSETDCTIIEDHLWQSLSIASWRLTLNCY